MPCIPFWWAMRAKMYVHHVCGCCAENFKPCFFWVFFFLGKVATLSVENCFAAFSYLPGWLLWWCIRWVVVLVVLHIFPCEISFTVAIMRSVSSVWARLFFPLQTAQLDKEAIRLGLLRLYVVLQCSEIATLPNGDTLAAVLDLVRTLNWITSYFFLGGGGGGRGGYDAMVKSQLCVDRKSPTLPFAWIVLHFLACVIFLWPMAVFLLLLLLFISHPGLPCICTCCGFDRVLPVPSFMSWWPVASVDELLRHQWAQRLSAAQRVALGSGHFQQTGRTDDQGQNSIWFDVSKSSSPSSSSCFFFFFLSQVWHVVHFIIIFFL